jgi:hypothetical protein
LDDWETVDNLRGNLIDLVVRMGVDVLVQLLRANRLTPFLYAELIYRVVAKVEDFQWTQDNAAVMAADISSQVAYLQGIKDDGVEVCRNSLYSLVLALIENDQMMICPKFLELCMELLWQVVAALTNSLRRRCTKVAVRCIWDFIMAPIVEPVV